VRITADTNVLVRAAVLDEPMQSALAVAALLEADMVAATLPALCEFVWVLMRGYKRNAAEVVAGLRKLVESAGVVADRPAVEAGLAILERGGDFADGVIAFEGRRAGGSVFTSFDRDAVALIGAIGGDARLLSG
jgi:predicted nucleic-acid-binding protein